MGSKFSHRRQTARKPPICIKPPPKPPVPPVSPGPLTWPGPGPIPEHLRHKVKPPPKPPFPPILTRNLIYHVYPRADNPACLANLLQIRKRLHLFNGKKIFALARHQGEIPPATIRQLLGPSCTFLEFPNDPRLRDTATFLPLLRTVRSTDPTEATFYAHTKGSSPHIFLCERLALATQYWRNAMYHNLLDLAAQVRQTLLAHPCVGTWLFDHTRTPRGAMTSPTGWTHGTWHYPGTFFWFRNDCFFANPDWAAVGDDPWANEMHLGGIFHAHHAHALLWRGPPDRPTTPNLYDPATYPHGIPD